MCAILLYDTAWNIGLKYLVNFNSDLEYYFNTLSEWERKYNFRLLIKK